MLCRQEIELDQCTAYGQVKKFRDPSALVQEVDSSTAPSLVCENYEIYRNDDFYEEIHVES